MFIPFERRNSFENNMFQENNNSNNIHNSIFLESDQYLFTHNDLNLDTEFPTKLDGNENSILKENFYFSQQNIEKSNLRTGSKSNLQIGFDKPISNILNEDEIISIIKNKMELSDKIKKIFDSYSNIQNNVCLQNIKKVITERIDKRRKRINKEIKNEEIQFGRKKKDDLSIRNHNKYAPDNIINKIKNIIKKYLILFVNNIISSLYGTAKINKILTSLNLPKHAAHTLIKDIDYKSLANKTSKKDNLDLLNFSIEKFLSHNVSTRYGKINKTKNLELNKYNKIIIDHLLKDEKNKDIFNFIFKELNLEDWMDIFIHKKDLNDLLSFYLLDNEQRKIVEESFIRIEDIFEELTAEGDVYFFCFILLIYNYKRYYSVKQERKSKNRKIEFNKLIDIKDIPENDN
jgi:hypothetical protein